MPAAYIKFQVLDVGQGTGNFIEIFDASDKLINTVLVDFGSEHATQTLAGGPSIDYVVGRLKKMAQPTIDTLITSHSDYDHISLLNSLLKSFYPVGTPGKKPEDTLLIKFMGYGGAFEKYKKGKGTATNILATIKKYMAGKAPEPFSGSFSSFSAPSPLPYREVEGLKLWVLIANAADAAPGSKPVVGAKRKASTTDSFAINTNSVVLVMDFAGIKFAPTGDATGVTLYQCNQKLTATVVATYIKPVFMLTMPHHGSATTTFNLKGVGGDTEDNLKKFSGKVAAQTVTTSADFVESFKHPSEKVIAYFWPHLESHIFFQDPSLPMTGRHFYTAYFLKQAWDVTAGLTSSKWPAIEYWYSIQTGQNIFSTIYYSYSKEAEVELPRIPGEQCPESRPTAAWRFRLSASAGHTSWRRTRPGRSTGCRTARNKSPCAGRCWPGCHLRNCPRYRSRTIRLTNGFERRGMTMANRLPPEPRAPARELLLRHPLRLRDRVLALPALSGR